MKNYYEFLGLIPGNLAENEIEAVIKKIADFFVSEGAEIAHQEYWGRKRLAYPIKHLKHGYYFIIEFRLEPNLLVDLEKKLKINESIMRHLIINAKPKTREQREKEKVKKQMHEKKENKEKVKETIVEKNKTKDDGKISLDELDQKLDEILKEKI